MMVKVIRYRIIVGPGCGSDKVLSLDIRQEQAEIYRVEVLTSSSTIFMHNRYRYLRGMYDNGSERILRTHSNDF